MEPPSTVTAKTSWPVNWRGDNPKQPDQKPRGKLRTPRDPRRVKKVSVRPPRKNPLTGRVTPYKNERRLVYEAEEYPLEDGEPEENE